MITILACPDYMVLQLHALFEIFFACTNSLELQ